MREADNVPRDADSIPTEADRIRREADGERDDAPAERLGDRYGPALTRKGVAGTLGEHWGGHFTPPVGVIIVMQPEAVSTDTIATYDARWLEGRFHIELTADSVRVQGSYAFGNPRVEAVIPLNSLQPRVERLWVRSRFFSAGIWCVALGFVGFGILTKQFRMSPYDMLPGMGLTFGIIGILLAVFTCRRTEFARFVSNGGVPELDVARSGEQAEFEAFVNKLVAAISAARGPATSGQPIA